MVKTYSRKSNGSQRLSPNFKVVEFACKDGSDIILIDTLLVELLQAIRDHYNQPVVISSAYRTASYNGKIGGAKNSQHVQGRAADIRISGVDPRDIARWVESELRPGGLGLYDYAPTDKAGFVHVDSRDGKARWVQTKSTDSSTYRVVGSIITDYLDAGAVSRATLRRGAQGADVLYLQQLLVKNGFPYNAVFDTSLEAAVRQFQTANKLSVDGIVGKNTWAALEGTN